MHDGNDGGSCRVDKKQQRNGVTVSEANDERGCFQTQNCATTATKLIG